MPIDQNSLGAHVAAQMEAIEADYADTDAQIGTIVTIVEVLSQERGSDVRVRPSDPRVHATLGILRWAETLTIASATQSAAGRWSSARRSRVPHQVTLDNACYVNKLME
jgi:hypothetical protein